MPAERRPRPRRPRLRRAAIVLVAVLVLVPVGAVIFQTVHGRGTTPVVEQRTLPSPQAPRPPASRPVSAAFVIARQRERAITRLEGLGIPVFCGASHGREVALTFDDGPGPYTARILAILRRHHAQATFFLVGNRIRYWPRLPAAEATIGAVGDHTWSHADLGRLPRTIANGEIDRARTAIASAANTEVRLFRTPYGRNPTWLGHALAARAMLEIRWSVDSDDYVPGITATAIVRRVARHLHPGGIVLMHDLHAVTVRALPRLLALLQARHLHPVTVPELLRTDPPSYRQLREDDRGRGCVDLATAGPE
jgi:peptidoglycan/xylan/chitin deacetylase (PgdA/CDA1 family)